MWSSPADSALGCALVARNWIACRIIPTMLKTSGKVQPTGYWTFFCTPAKWAVDEFLSQNIECDGYRVTDWQKDWFAAGQFGVIRVGVDNRTKSQLGNKPRLQPGIYAIVEILGPAKPRQASAYPFWLEEPPADEDGFAVEIKYLKNLLHSPVLFEDVKDDSQITDTYLLKGFQASSMPLDKSTFDRIIALQSVSTLSEIQQLEAQYANATPEVKERISKHIERGVFANKIKKLNKFKCQICDASHQNPFSFVKKNGEPYIEVHHVVFVSKLLPGVLQPSNLITVCPNHHRQLHYGNAELRENTVDTFVFQIDGDSMKIKKLQ